MSTESRSVWPRCIFTDRLGLEIPLLQAPMAGAATPELAASVSRAGGLGGLGLGTASPSDASRLIQAARALGASRINANVFLHAKPMRDEALERSALEPLKPLARSLGASEPPPLREPFGTFGPEMLEMLLDQQPEVVTFHFASPETDVVEQLHSVGIVIGGNATTVTEAQDLASNGCDFVIAQGAEAGGHRGTFKPSVDESRIGTFSLVPQVVDAVDIPVVAAGGISDGRGFAAALLLGASAVQVGTAFLRSPEAAITPGHRSALENRRAEDVTVSYAFSGRPARAFRNELSAALRDSPDGIAEFPVQFVATAPLRSVSQPDHETEAMWAGQSFPLTQSGDAEEITRRLATEAQHLLRRC